VNISSKRLFAGVIAASLVLAACGDDDDESTDATEGATATTAASTETTAAGTDTTMGGSDTTVAEGGGEVELADGEVFVTGSSTVEPISIRVGELAAEQTGGGLAVTVEGPGTGDGFETFCAGGADITDASRPIREEEATACADAGVEYVEIPVAIDGLTVGTSVNNSAVECLDVPALYALVGPESEGFENWSDAAELGAEVGSTSTFPDAPLSIYGPGEESGTYDSFVEFAIADLAEERGQDVFTRADYSSSANDNLIVEGIESADTTLGWVGYAYYEAEQERMKALGVDAGDGCVVPTPETIADGSYPFSRTLYIYVNTANAADNPAVASYVDLYLSDEGIAQVSDAGYVQLPADQLEAARAAWAGR
jgi:phosphate transport system substrate-binding protein